MGACTTFLSILGFTMMFEKETEPEKIVLINEEDNTLSDQIQRLNIDESELMPILTLKEALRIKDLYLIAFVHSFDKMSIDIFSINYKVNQNCIFIYDTENCIK